MARRFTLLDDPYFDALVRVLEAFAEAELPVALVGGGAAQAWIASLRTGCGALRLSDEPTLRSALRRTRDLDFATRIDEASALALLNGIAMGAGHGAHVLGPRTLRLGEVSIAVTIEPADLSGMSALYDVFLDGRTHVDLRRGAAAHTIPVIDMAHLLVTKLTRRGDKAKDLVDVTELLAAARDAGRELDLLTVRHLVHDRPEALDLLAEIEAASSGESE